ncbi:MAG: winged helix-turn-helix transcriptional regulator [Treponema sp.]|nr:winged helix-turn-helix transcriptional regulator [Treponema sp.]
MAELLADSNGVSIKVVRFNGKEKADGIALRNEYGEKCLVVAMKQAFDYCADVVNETRTSFTKGIRNDKPLFDRDAFREVWFNACLHNNWADGTPPAIYIFTDRMEIISTGGLPANLSEEDFFKGISKPVNEELAKLFIRLDLMEQTGYGIPLVTKRYGKAVFEFLDFFLRVTIPFEFELEIDPINEDDPTNDPIIDPINEDDPTNDPINEDDPINDPIIDPINGGDPTNDPINDPINEDDPINDPIIDPINEGDPTNDPINDPINGGDPTNDPINDPINEDDPTNDPINDPINEDDPTNDPIKILSLIESNPTANYEEYANHLGVSAATIKRKIGELKTSGRIVRIGAKKNGHWEIVGQNKAEN